MGRKAGRSPSAHEKALWDRYTSQVNRRPGSGSADAGPALVSSKDKPDAAPRMTNIPDEFSIGARAQPRKSATATQSTAPAKLDQKLQRKLNRGKVEPEGRFDLHGMTLAQAQPALNGFLLRSFTEGRRLVLVITGKGRERTSKGPLLEQTGLLKRHVPIWLREGPMAAIVQDIVPAHQRHGGSGAYYVYLRRRRD